MASTTRSAPRPAHPSEGHKLKLSIGVVNPDDFLDKLKPKAPPVLSQQQMFDAAIRVLYRQGGPSIKVDDKGNKTTTTFSSRKGGFFVSPVLSFLNPEDIRRLQKATDYHRLQALRIWGMTPPTVQQREDQQAVKTYLEDRGVASANWAFLQALETKHFEWAGKCITVDDYDEQKEHIMSHLYGTMIGFAQAFYLKTDCLNLFRPA